MRGILSILAWKRTERRIYMFLTLLWKSWIHYSDGIYRYPALEQQNDCYYAIVKSNSSKSISGSPIYFNYASRIDSLNMNFHMVNMNVLSTERKYLNWMKGCLLNTFCYCQNREHMDMQIIKIILYIMSLILNGMNLMRICSLVVQHHLDVYINWY